MKIVRHNQPPTNPGNPEVSPFLNLALSEGVSIGYDEERNRSFIESSEPFEYPDSEGAHESLRRLLLERAGEDKLILPENFVTLGQALNDAGGSYKSGRGQINARELFEELGEGLKEVATDTGMVPRNPSYLNVIYSREEGGAKLLPPIMFVQFSEAHREQASRHVVDALWKSLLEGAANDTQRRLVMDAFGGFTGAYQW